MYSPQGQSMNPGYMLNPGMNIVTNPRNKNHLILPGINQNSPGKIPNQYATPFAFQRNPLIMSPHKMRKKQKLKVLKQNDKSA